MKLRSLFFIFACILALSVLASAAALTSESNSHKRRSKHNRMAKISRLKLKVKTIDDKIAKMMCKLEANDSEERKRIKTTYNEILKIMMSQGAKMKKFALKFITDSNRYIIATEDIAKGEIIAEIPLKHMITVYTSEVKAIYDNLAPKSRSIPEVIALIIWIHQNRTKSSLPNRLHQLYFEMLPKDMTNIPLLYDEADKSLYKSSPILSVDYEVNLDYRKRQLQFLKSKGLLDESTSLKDWIKSASLFGSRDFSIGKDLGNNYTDLRALVPLIDLFNVDNKPNLAHWKYDKKRKVFEIEVRNGIKRGEEIFLNYGSDTNFQFLKDYGFTISKPFVPMSFSASSKEKVDFEVGLGLEKALGPFRTLYNHNMKGRLLESKVLIHLKENLERLSSQFEPTVLEKAQENLMQKNLSFNQLNISRVIVEQKEVIDKYINAATDFLDFIKSKSKRVTTLITSSEFQDYYGYLKTLNRR